MSRHLFQIGQVILLVVITSVVCLLSTYQYDKKREEHKISKALKEDTSTRYQYIHIPTLHIKKLIQYGNMEEIIEKDDVAYLSIERETIYLAGHSIPTVFGSLHYAKVGTEVFLISSSKKVMYEVVEIKIVAANDISIFTREMNEETLILITCLNDDTYRLIVTCQQTNTLQK